MLGLLGAFALRPVERVAAFYNKRGTCEQRIKEGKNAMLAFTTSTDSSEKCRLILSGRTICSRYLGRELSELFR